MLHQAKDRIAERVPELDLDQNEIEWRTLDDSHEGLLVNGGGLDGGDGAYFAKAGEDLHAVGSPDPIVPGHIGCTVIQPDGGLRRSCGARPAAGLKPDAPGIP